MQGTYNLEVYTIYPNFSLLKIFTVWKAFGVKKL